MKLAQPHPGHELKQQIDASGFSQRRLAKQLDIAETQFNEILHGKRPFTPALCLALQRLFGLNAKLLNRKQADYDLEQARAKATNAKVVEAEEFPNKPLVRVKAEAYDYRIYELEVAYMMQLAGTPESEAARASMERVTANYHRAYPDRPLAPKPRPDVVPAAPTGFLMQPEKKPRKPYTKRAKAA